VRDGFVAVAVLFADEEEMFFRGGRRGRLRLRGVNGAEGAERERGGDEGERKFARHCYLEPPLLLALVVGAGTLGAAGG
jgi:hypothetical protein